MLSGLLLTKFLKIQIMKKNAFIIIATSLVAVSCNNNKPQADNTASAERERDSLQALLNQKDSTLSSYLMSFNDIQRTLDSVNVKEKNIYIKTERTSDIKTNVLAEINAEIAAINTLMDKNRENITKLNKQLKAGGGKNKQLEVAIKSLNTQLVQKQDELTALNVKLNGLNREVMQLQTSIGFLNAQNAAQAETIAQERNELHKAFYIVGTSKDLEKENIIDKKGGLLGIGKTSELKDDFNAKKFTQIDYTQLNSIPVNSKKVDIITSHPTNSYRLEKENGIIKDIVITNSEAFWNTSKYLVIIKGA